MRGCVNCGARLGARTLRRQRAGRAISGQCKRCWGAARRKPDLQCVGCGGSISRFANGARRCKPCAWLIVQADPAVQARRAASNKAAAQRPDVIEARSLSAREYADERLQWCPPAYRPAYRSLMNKRIKASEARALILEEIAVKQDRVDPLAAAIINAGLTA